MGSHVARETRGFGMLNRQGHHKHRFKMYYPKLA